MRAILAFNLAKYKYFLMRPSLFDKYHKTTYSLQFQFQYLLKCGQKCHFLNSRFFESACYVLIFNYDKYFPYLVFRGYTREFHRYFMIRIFELSLQKILAEFPQNFCQNFCRNSAKSYRSKRNVHFRKNTN